VPRPSATATVIFTHNGMNSVKLVSSLRSFGNVALSLASVITLAFIALSTPSSTR
jgi:hypothetical protein